MYGGDMLRVILSVAALALLLSSFVQAQTIRSFYLESLPAGLPGHQGQNTNEIKTIDVAMPRLKIKQTGLLTSRLSTKDRERWKSLERLVFATGHGDEPLHPVLQELWRWVDSCGHLIYLEIPEDKTVQNSTAGSFNIDHEFSKLITYYIYVKFLDGAGNATVGTLPARQVNLAQGYSVPKIFLPEIRK